MPPGLSRWCHRHLQVLLHGAVFYMTATADVLYSSSNKYSKKRKKPAEGGEVKLYYAAQCYCAARWEMDAERFQNSVLISGGTSPGKGGEGVPTEATPLGRSDQAIMRSRGDSAFLTASSNFCCSPLQERCRWQ